MKALKWGSEKMTLSHARRSPDSNLVTLRKARACFLGAVERPRRAAHGGAKPAKCPSGPGGHCRISHFQTPNGHFAGLAGSGPNSWRHLKRRYAGRPASPPPAQANSLSASNSRYLVHASHSSLRPKSSLFASSRTGRDRHGDGRRAASALWHSNMPTPDYIKQAAIRAMCEGDTFYTSSVSNPIVSPTLAVEKWTPHPGGGTRQVRISEGNYSGRPFKLTSLSRLARAQGTSRDTALGLHNSHAASRAEIGVAPPVFAGGDLKIGGGPQKRYERTTTTLCATISTCSSCPCPPPTGTIFTVYPRGSAAGPARGC